MESIQVAPSLRRYHEQSKNGVTNLAGKYRLIAELGQGGMATVYLAVAIGNGGFRRLAVVKVLRPEMAVDEEFVQMFLDEAKLCARLAHPNIVHTYDVGGDDIGHLIAMEYLDGVSLHAAIGRLGRGRGKLTFPYHAKVLLEVLEGLRYAHALCDYDGKPLQIVHRDVTPHNIFVTYEGQVKLLDFGIAKAATSSVRTATGVVKGKLTYMAPEQARGEPVDGRTDLFSVGVMLWEAITGRRRLPTGLSEPALFSRLIMGEPPESPEAASHGWPAEADAVVLKALAPHPSDRYQTAAEFHDALEAVLRLLPPVQLRDLGAMLTEAFAQSRQGIRNIIEEQFRLLDAGGPPSDHPPQLPAIPPHGPGTGSQALPPGTASATPTLTPSEDVGELRTQVTLSSSKNTASPRVAGKTITRAVALAGLAVLALALVLGIAAVRQALPAGPPSAQATMANASSVAPEPTRAPIIAAEPSTTVDPSAGAASAPAVAESAARPSVRTRPSPALGSRPTAPAVKEPAALGRPAKPDPGSAETTSGDTNGDTTTTGTPPMHKPDGKPKVQLERENPWQ